MSQNVTSAIKLSVGTTEDLVLGSATGRLNATQNYAQNFATGTGANKIQRLWSKSDSAAGAAVTYVLSALLDELGRTIPMTIVRSLYLVNKGADPLIVGGAADDPWVAPFGDASDKVKVPPGGALLLVAPGAAGFAVVSGTSDQIKIDPGAQTVAFDITIAGE